MKERYSHELSAWHKLLGIWRINKNSVDTKWGYFAPRFGFELRFNRGGYFSQRCSVNICLIWGAFNIALPFKTSKEESCEWLDYGFYSFEDSFVLKWGDKNKYFRIPFVAWEFDWHKAIDKDGAWIDGSGSWDNSKIKRETFDYSYTLSSEEVQQRKAVCFVEERQWHKKWAPFIKMNKRCIDISFSDEVGERSGSWKGGTIGCSYDMLEGETIEGCLRRMEKERVFN